MTHILLIRPDQSFTYQQVSQSANQVRLDMLHQGRLPDYIKLEVADSNQNVNYAAVVWKDWVIAHPADAEPPTRDKTHLTRRQLDVLLDLSEGLTGKQIAGRLKISRRSVSMHISGLKHNLGASTIAECVQKAARLGILKPGG